MRLKILTVAFLSSLTVWAAENQCLSGSSRNTRYQRALVRSSAPLVVDFRSTTSFKLNEGRLGCTSGQCPPSKSSTSWMTAMSEIPKECIRASMKRQVSQSGYECRRQYDGDWQYVKHSASSKTKPCLDNTTVDFAHFVTNRVVCGFKGVKL